MLWCVRNDVYEEAPKTIEHTIPNYQPTLPKVEKKDGFEAVIVADLEENDENLKAMIADFQNAFPYKTRLVNIAEYPFKGGCLGL